MAQHSRYWSCTKFADWIRGTPKPKAETFEGWDAWHITAKKTHEFRYWLAEEGLDLIQDAVTWPTSKLYDIKYYINNRWVTRTHTLTSSLKRGDWHEFDTRVLHCLFDELVNYIEVEEAWSNVSWDKEAREKYKAPFYASGWWRWRTWRCPEAGLDKLKWAASLTNEEWLSDDEKHLAEPTGQAKSAIELMALYDWWKNIRPHRPDPHVASGWTAICEKNRDNGVSQFRTNRTEEERAESQAALDKCTEIENEYDREDEEMLIRLIKIRRNMWT